MHSPSKVSGLRSSFRKPPDRPPPPLHWCIATRVDLRVGEFQNAKSGRLRLRPREVPRGIADASTTCRECIAESAPSGIHDAQVGSTHQGANLGLDHRSWIERAPPFIFAAFGTLLAEGQKNYDLGTLEVDLSLDHAPPGVQDQD